MAFPQVQSVTPTTTSSATVHNIDMPATVNAGDLLIALVTNNQGNINSYPSGWTVLYDHPTVPMFLKNAVGTEGGGTISVGTASATNMGTQVYRITGWYDSGTLLNDVEFAQINDNSATPDPPSLNPSNWGAEDTLWIVRASWFNTATLSSYPGSYVGGVSSGPLGARMATAHRELAAASEDPGVFTKSTTGGWHAHTIAIRPADPVVAFEGTAEVSFDGEAAMDVVSDIVFTGGETISFDGVAQTTQNAVFEGAEEVSFDGLADLSGGAILMTGEGEVSFDGTAVLNQEALFEGFADVEMNGLAQLGVIQGFAAQAALMFDGSASLSAIGWQEVDVATNQIWTVKK